MGGPNSEGDADAKVDTMGKKFGRGNAMATTVMPTPAQLRDLAALRNMTRKFAIALLGAAAVGLIGVCIDSPASAGDVKTSPAFRVCKATFALCTIAACDPIPGKPDQVTCHCTVNDGYSVGSDKVSCANLEGQHSPNLSSRYYPFKSAIKCSEDRPWAFCLDSPCVVDENNPRAAQCTCNLVNTVPKPPVAPWVFVTNAHSPTSCTTGIVSSATVEDVEAVTDFLKTSKSLPPFLPIHWLPDGK
jgi:hypothetical protein